MEKRPTSLGGYGSIVPYHAASTYDPLYGKEGTVVDLPTESYESPEQILERLSHAEELIEVGTEPGELYYAAQCSDFSWYGSGISDLEEDLPLAWKLSEDLKQTLSENHGSEMEVHRPCFVIVAPARYGIFWSVLRGFKDRDEDGDDYETVYASRAGVLMENPILSWPALEEMVDSDGPIPLVETEVESATIRGKGRPLEQIVPVDHERTGDADILAAKNVYTQNEAEASEEICEAIANTSRLTYRVRGGTVGFENEREFRAQNMSVLRPHAIDLGGWPIVIGSPLCDALSD